MRIPLPMLECPQPVRSSPLAAVGAESFGLYCHQWLRRSVVKDLTSGAVAAFFVAVVIVIPLFIVDYWAVSQGVV